MTPLAAKDPSGNVWNAMALAAIGARRIEYTATGIEISPDGLDLTGYPKACVAALVPQLIKAASNACDAVTNQVTTTETHVPAYVNAAAWVSAAGGVPSVDPYKTRFANLAASMGTSAAALTTLIEDFAVAPVDLVVALNTLKAAAAAPTAAAASLATALSAFETSLTAVVAALNAALGAAAVADVIKPPDPISIPGINA